MNEIRRLFKERGLLDGGGKSALKVAGLDPWRLRAEGRDRKLTGQEIAVALGHIAEHRLQIEQQAQVRAKAIFYIILM
jgi:CRISPR-associated endonuclease Csn1